MEKQIYSRPCLKVLLFVEEPVMGNTLSIFGKDEPGEFLGKEGTFENSDFPNSIDNSDFPRFRNIWDEEE